MKHAGKGALDKLEPLLKQLRSHGELKEKSRGCFYLRGCGFLHFHEHGADELYADIGVGADFERVSVTTAAERKALLRLVSAVLDED